MIDSSGRIINLASAAQAAVDPEALVGCVKLNDGMAYAQSKLAITMWSRSMALSLKNDGPVIIGGAKFVLNDQGTQGNSNRHGRWA